LKFQGRARTHIVSDNLAFSVVFKMSVALEPALDEFSEFVGESGVEEVVHAETGTGGLAGVGWADALLCCSYAMEDGESALYKSL
jgi:hypothetical protein